MTAYAGIICPTHGKTDIDLKNYVNQLADGFTSWLCPACGSVSAFDDARYEQLQAERDEHVFSRIQLHTNANDVPMFRVDNIDGLSPQVAELIDKALNQLCVELGQLSG